MIIDLKEYPIINQLIVLGEKTKKFEKEIKKVINSKAKKSLIKSNLVKDINIIKTLYSSLGYNFAKVETKLKKIDEENYDLLFLVERGEKTKISKINFIGNNNVKTKRLKDIIASEENKFWKVISRNTVLSQNLVELDKRLITNYYKSIGFYEVKISSNLAKVINNKNAELTYKVEEGNRFTFGKFSTVVDDVFDKKIFFPLNDIYIKYAGNYYSPFKVKEILEEIDLLISNNNLQFVEHRVKEDISGNKISLVFDIFEGEKITVERINKR